MEFMQKSSVMDDESSDDGACAVASCDTKKNFFELLSKMKLTDKYPQKLSLRDAMTVRQETLGTIHTTDQLQVLPYLILQKIMMCDQRCRSCLLQVTKQNVSTGDGGSDSVCVCNCVYVIVYVYVIVCM